MAGLVNFALFLILGVLQVSGGEFKDIEIENTTCEVTCLKKVTALLENEKSINIVIEERVLKKRAVEIMLGIQKAAEQCCGKEYEERKCLQTVLRELEKFLALEGIYEKVYFIPFTQTLANLSLLGAYAANELDCCYKIETCTQELEYPTVSYKGAFKECKGENCADGLNKFVKQISNYLATLLSTDFLQERVINSFANLQKFKEKIPKDEKCKEEKELRDVRKEIRYFNLYLELLIVSQTILTSKDKMMVTSAAPAAIEILTCPNEKDSKQCNLCY